MLLDAWDAVFLWLSVGANKQEIEESDRIVFDYLRTDPSQRSSDLPIFRIRQGFEPPNFTGFFGIWDSTLFQVNKKNININDYSCFINHKISLNL